MSTVLLNRNLRLISANKLIDKISNEFQSISNLISEGHIQVKLSKEAEKEFNVVKLELLGGEESNDHLYKNMNYTEFLVHISNVMVVELQQLSENYVKRLAKDSLYISNAEFDELFSYVKKTITSYQDLLESVWSSTLKLQREDIHDFKYVFIYSQSANVFKEKYNSLYYNINMEKQIDHHEFQLFDMAEDVIFMNEQLNVIQTSIVNLVALVEYDQIFTSYESDELEKVQTIKDNYLKGNSEGRNSYSEYLLGILSLMNEFQEKELNEFIEYLTENKDGLNIDMAVPYHVSHLLLGEIISKYDTILDSIKTLMTEPSEKRIRHLVIISVELGRLVDLENEYKMKIMEIVK